MVQIEGDIVDWWIVKQLRAMVLTDLREFVPHGYFESAAEDFKIHDSIKNSNHFSREVRWGYLASKLGLRLYFESTAIMSARQVSACDVLMNLGLFAGAEALQGSTAQLSKNAEDLGVSDGNSGAVAAQLADQIIPTFSDNVNGALKQYLTYLTPREAKPFLPLLESVPCAMGDLLECTSDSTKIKNEGATKVNSILFLSADPTNASRLRLGEEFREIQEALQLSKLREQFELNMRMSARPEDVSQALLDTQPQIVHFSGHGSAEGELCFENNSGEIHPISPKALAALFEQFTNHVICVLLNSCFSQAQANAISRHIEYVIGMNDAIGDKAAIAFATGFYQGLGGGRSIDDSYKLGCAQIEMQNISEQLTPVLIKRTQIYP